MSWANAAAPTCFNSTSNSGSRESQNRRKRNARSSSRSGRRRSRPSEQGISTLSSMTLLSDGPTAVTKASQPRPEITTMTEPLTPETFLPHVDKVFHVKDGRHALTLSRVDVRPMEEWEAALLRHQAFTLIFGGPPGDVLREGLYVLEVEGG